MQAPSSAVGTFQERIRCYYLAALRDAGTHFGAKGQFWRPFLKDANLPVEKKKEIEDLLEQVNKEVVGSHESFKKAVARLQSVQDVLPLGSGDVVSVEAVPTRMFDMLSRAQINLGGSTGARIPVHRHGEGTQSLSVLMLFRAFIEAWPEGHPFVALEEPEAHLHPSAIRALWSIVEDLPGQKLVTTHSGDLLSEVPAHALRRLHRGPNGVEVRRLKAGTLNPTQTQKFDFHVRQSKGELLFARCWLLVEGETEMTLLPELARALSLSFEKSGVRCVQYRQADIELFIKVADDFGISWCVMPDDDDQGKKDQKKARDSLNGRAEADILYVPPQKDIERVLCDAGFEHVYEARRSARKQIGSPITAAKGTPAYWNQLLKVMERGYKPAAAHQVAAEIHAGAAVPPFLESVVRGAIKLAEANQC